MSGIVILGAGQAGFQLCLSLRKAGYDGAIDLIGNEGRHPYQRPPLSKGFLKGEITDEERGFRPAAFFDQENITCHLNDAAVSVDSRAKTVTLSSGRMLGYAHLVFATGSRNHVPPIDGIDAPDVAELRDAADATSLAARLTSRRKIAVIGAGFIGLEFASVARAKGSEVTVIEAAPRAMGRSLSQTMADYLVDELRERGVVFHFNAPASKVRREDGAVIGLAAGNVDIEADLVLLCAGVVANSELA